MKANKFYATHVGEKTREELLMESPFMDLDDTFQFNCTQCGKCCRNRHSGDIILSPRDIYAMSKELNMTPSAFVKAYCIYTIGCNSKIPLLLFNTVGSDKHCPLLKNNKCSVHAGKPTACALYPLGRHISSDDPEKIKYVIQPIQCGRKPKTYTVRQWLEGFGLEPEDRCYIKWSNAIDDLSPLLQKLEATEDPLTVRLIQEFTLFAVYQQYDTQRPFLEQFEENVEVMLHMLSDIPSLKATMKKYGATFPEIGMTSLHRGIPGGSNLLSCRSPIMHTK